MQLKVIYSILGREKQNQLINVPNELIEKLKEYDNPKKAEDFLSKKLQETICRKKELDSFEVKIHEFYEKKEPKKKKSKPQQQQGFER